MNQIFFDHQVIDTYPDDAVALPQADGSLAIVRLHIAPDGTITQEQVKSPIAAGTWHAAGYGFRCGFMKDRPDCTRCHPPSPHGSGGRSLG